jgi:hypothetical protein
MPQHAWIGVDWVPSRKSVKITPANSDSMNANQSLSAGEYRARDIDVDQLAGSVQQNSSHIITYPRTGQGSLHWSSHPPRELYEHHLAAVKQYSHPVFDKCLKLPGGTLIQRRLSSNPSWNWA